jgi:hypothetical protein
MCPALNGKPERQTAYRALFKQAFFKTQIYCARAQLRKIKSLESGYINGWQFIKSAKLTASSINEIRDTTSKAWALGNDRFKENIQLQLGRRVKPAVKRKRQKISPIQNQSNVTSPILQI